MTKLHSPRTPSRGARLLASAAMMGAVSGCMVGPDYHQPAPVISARFKETPPPAGWQFANPNLAEAPKGKWWQIFNDPVLNGLEEQVATSNQNVKQYEAQAREAAAMIDSIRGQLYPTLNGSFDFSRNSQGSSSHSTANNGQSYSHTFTTNTWSTAPQASWTPDIWGKVRRQIEQQVASAQASLAEVAAMTLSYQSTLAQDYFQLRYEDSQIKLLEQNVGFYAHGLRILENQQAAGTADPAAVLQQRYQYESTRAQVEGARVSRAQYEHAIAVLTGHAPADLTIAPGELPHTLPLPPTAIPGELLQRRPDIAQSERTLEANHADIGVQIAAFYPNITLTANYGYSGDPIGQLIQAATRSWSLMAQSSETFFNGGTRTAAIRNAYAQYDASVAQYRQTVLNALQSTENDLSNLRYLSQQLDIQNTAVGAADQAVKVSMNEYLAGTQNFTTVLTAEQSALGYQQTALQLREQEAIYSVTLITDLGGGWNRDVLPSKSSLQTDQPLLPSFIQPNKQGARPADVVKANGR